MVPKISRFTTGLLVAATGVGAGDLVVSALAGARYGTALLWAIAVGAVLKYFLNEGLARWEVATGTTLLEGWIERLPRIVPLYFGAYLVFWAFLVAGTLISYTGVAANTLLPLPVTEHAGKLIWGGGQSLLAVGLIHFGGFRWVEYLMRWFIGLMFVVTVGAALLVVAGGAPVAGETVKAAAGWTGGDLVFIVGLVGGVGGTLTIMCYAYWLREGRDMAAIRMREVRLDLGVAYGLTALFGMAVMVIAAGVQPEAVRGEAMVFGLAERLGDSLGPAGEWAFKLGFWAAVLSSLLGVWSGVPYLFADLLRRYRRRYAAGRPGAEGTLRGAPAYRAFLWYLAVPPLLLVFFQRPDWIGVAYAVAGALFMPFLAALILYLNNRRDLLGHWRNGWAANLGLGLCLALFLVLFALQLGKLSGG